MQYISLLLCSKYNLFCYKADTIITHINIIYFTMLNPSVLTSKLIFFKNTWSVILKEK